MYVYTVVNKGFQTCLTNTDVNSSHIFLELFLKFSYSNQNGAFVIYLVQEFLFLRKKFKLDMVFNLVYYCDLY